MKIEFEGPLSSIIEDMNEFLAKLKPEAEAAEARPVGFAPVTAEAKTAPVDEPAATEAPVEEPKPKRTRRTKAEIEAEKNAAVEEKPAEDELVVEEVTEPAVDLDEPAEDEKTYTREDVTNRVLELKNKGVSALAIKNIFMLLGLASPKDIQPSQYNQFIALAKNLDQ